MSAALTCSRAKPSCSREFIFGFDAAADARLQLRRKAEKLTGFSSVIFRTVSETEATMTPHAGTTNQGSRARVRWPSFGRAVSEDCSDSRPPATRVTFLFASVLRGILGDVFYSLRMQNTQATDLVARDRAPEVSL